MLTSQPTKLQKRQCEEYIFTIIGSHIGCQLNKTYSTGDKLWSLDQEIIILNLCSLLVILLHLSVHSQHPIEGPSCQSSPPASVQLQISVHSYIWLLDMGIQIERPQVVGTPIGVQRIPRFQFLNPKNKNGLIINTSFKKTL